jgi:hypothetical protein
MMQVPLVNKAGDQVGVTIIDDEDYSRVVGYGDWHLHSDGYAHRKIDGKTALLHRVILGIVDRDVHVDHWDHDPLNNQRSNLRPGTQADNNRNPTPNARADSSSKHKGVGRYRGGWRAQGWAEGRTVWLGRYATEDEAVAAYEEWRKNA